MSETTTVNTTWLRLGRSLGSCTAIAWLALASVTPALAGENSGNATASARIEGTWVVTVTLRDCATGAPAGPPFDSLVTFHEGGTIHESTGALLFAPNQRSDGHGVWKRLSPGVYSQHTVALVRFDTAPQPPFPGVLAGWQVIDQVVTMIDHDNMTSEGSGDFYDRQGQRYRAGCSTAVGRRFE